MNRIKSWGSEILLKERKTFSDIVRKLLNDCRPLSTQVYGWDSLVIIMIPELSIFRDVCLCAHCIMYQNGWDEEKVISRIGGKIIVIRVSYQFVREKSGWSVVPLFYTLKFKKGVIFVILLVSPPKIMELKPDVNYASEKKVKCPQRFFSPQDSFLLTLKDIF